MTYTKEDFDTLLEHLRFIIKEYEDGSSRYLRWEIQSAKEFLKELDGGWD